MVFRSLNREIFFVSENSLFGSENIKHEGTEYQSLLDVLRLRLELANDGIDLLK